AILRGRVGVGALVGDLAILLEREEAVREADGDEQLVPVLRTEFSPDPLAVGRRAFAHIHRHVEDPAPDAAHQLILPARRHLEVQAAQREGGRGERVVVLHEGAGDAELSERVAVVGLGEPTPRIAMAGGADELDGSGYGLGHWKAIYRIARPPPNP